MTLTPAQEALLALPFALNEHGFNGSNNVYIKKSAIRRRLSLVDPGWSQTPPVVVSQDGNTVALACTLTICGSTRSGVGVGVISRWNKDKTPMKDFSLALAILKAQKNADTDLLPRCAIQFNVGAYLKVEGVKDIKTEESLRDFLAKLPAPPAPPNAHWAANGGRERVGKFMKNIGMKWEAVSDLIEPGRTLSGLSDTTLDEAAFMVELAKLAFKPAAPQSPPPAPPPPTPAAAPKSDDKPRYSVPVASSTTPPPDEVVDLNQYFTPKPAATPAPIDPFNKSYASPYARRPTVPSYKNPTGQKERIGYIKCLPDDLDTKDIILVDGEPRTIIAAYPPEHGDRRFLLKDAAGEEHDYKMTLSLGNAEIVGGPKLAAAQDNPALAPMSGPHRLWAGVKAKAS